MAGAVSKTDTVERQMIDAGNDIIDFLNRYPDITSQLFRRMRNAMAKPDVRTLVAWLSTQQFIAIGLT
jgi:hypothetical protein